MGVLPAEVSALHWEVFTSKRPGLVRDLPPGNESLAWVANSSTLICGERDAVLVDTFLDHRTVRASGRLGRRQRQEPDHHLHHPRPRRPFLRHRRAAGALSPHAKAVAAPAVVGAMRASVSPDAVDGRWRRLFPGQIADRLPIAEALTGRFAGAGGSSAGRGRYRTDRHRPVDLPPYPVDRAARRRRRRLQRHPSVPSARATLRAGWNGSRRWTGSRRWRRARWWQGTNGRALPTAPPRSAKRGNICSISTGSMRPQRPCANFMTRCWRSIRITPIRVHCGVRPSRPRRWLERPRGSAAYLTMPRKRSSPASPALIARGKFQRT